MNTPLHRASIDFSIPVRNAEIRHAYWYQDQNGFRSIIKQKEEAGEKNSWKYNCWNDETQKAQLRPVERNWR